MSGALLDEPGMSPRSAETVRAAVDEALADGVRDEAGGGVVGEQIARYVDLAPCTCQRYLRALADAGELAIVWGVGESPRRSFLPADHPDAGGGGSYRDNRFMRGETA